jgi:hypothetical protein
VPKALQEQWGLPAIQVRRGALAQRETQGLKVPRGAREQSAQRERLVLRVRLEARVTWDLQAHSDLRALKGPLEVQEWLGPLERKEQRGVQG